MARVGDAWISRLLVSLVSALGKRSFKNLFCITMGLMHAVEYQLQERLSPLSITVAYIAAAVFSLILLAYCWQRSADGRLDLPVVGHVSETDFRPALEEGAEKVGTDHCRSR
jgi:hypothetical protein